MQAFEWETGSTSESHTTVVSDSLCGTVGGQRTAGIMRSLRGSHAGMFPGVDESLGSSGGQTRGAPGITTALDLPPGVELSRAETRLDAVEAGKPFAQQRPAGMTAAAMEETSRRHNARMKSTMCRDACR